MFEFIQNALLYFDLMEKGTANFHLWFLFRLTEYLGFRPDTTPAGFQGWFDLRKGAVVPFEPSHPLFINKEATHYFIELATLKINELEDFKISRNIRDILLTKLVEYYQTYYI